MAETGMNIKADPTIVGAAGNLARASQPFSMKGMADNFLVERGKMMDSIAINFEKGIQEVAKIDAPLRKSIKELATKISDGTYDNRKEREEMQVKLEGFRDELEGIGLFGKENKQKRADLLYEVNKYTKDAQATDAAVIEVITTFENESYDPAMTGAPALSLIQEIVNWKNGDDMGDGFSVSKDINGKPLFSYSHTGHDNVVTEFKNLTIAEVAKKLKNKNTGAIADINKFFNDERQAATTNLNYSREEELVNLENNLEEYFNDNKESFATTVRAKVNGQPMSYYEALHKQGGAEFEQILDTLFEMNPTLDANKDGEASDKEVAAWSAKAGFGTLENFNALVNVLTDPNPEQTRLAYGLAAKFYAEVEGGRAVDLGIEYRAEEGNSVDERARILAAARVRAAEKIAEAKLLASTKSNPDALTYPISQPFAGGVTGSNLNMVLDKLQSGTITMNDGGVYTRDIETNIWSTEDGSTFTGDQVVEIYQKAFNKDYPDNTKIFKNESQFAPFRGGEVDSDKIVETTDPITSNTTRGAKVIGQIETIFKADMWEADAQKALLGVLEGLYGQGYKELSTLISNFRDDNLGADIFDGGQMKFDFAGNHKENGVLYDLGTPTDAKKFIKNLNAFINY